MSTSIEHRQDLILVNNGDVVYRSELEQYQSETGPLLETDYEVVSFFASCYDGYEFMLNMYYA